MLSLGLVILDASGVDKGARGYFESPIVQVKQAMFGVVSAGRFLSVWKVKDQEISRLAGLLVESDSALVNVATLAAENRALRAQLSLRTKPPSRFLLASPLGLASGEMVINAGGLQEVAIGDSVVIGQVLVGRVISTSSYQARVRLPISEGEKISAAVRSGGVDGVRIASGIVNAIGGQMILEKVTLGEPLRVGDLVMTVGEGYERDLLIGKVAEILEKENDLFKSARIDPGTDYSRLDRVFVVIDR